MIGHKFNLTLVLIFKTFIIANYFVKCLTVKFKSFVLTHNLDQLTNNCKN